MSGETARETPPDHAGRVTRIVLRPITEADTELIVRWRNNPRVRRNFVYREVFSREIHERWFREHIRGAEDVLQWIICIPAHGEPGRPVGSVYLRDIDRTAGSAEYGIFIGEDDAVGRGIGTLAAREVVALAKGPLGLPDLRLRVFTDNQPAIGSYVRAGFAVTHMLPAVRCTDGEEKDMLLMEQMTAQSSEGETV